MKLFSLLFFSSLVGLTAQAASVQITGVQNASNFVAGASPIDIPVVYGATAGEACDKKLKRDEFCNNCTSNMACSERRIHSDLSLRIEFVVSEGISGYAAMGTIKNGVFVQLPSRLVTKSTNSLMNAGDVGFLEIKWGDICQVLSEEEGCDLATIDENIFVAISPDSYISSEEVTFINVKVTAPDSYSSDEITCGGEGDGVCSFVADPGDQKVYIDPIEPSGSYPTVNGLPVRALRLFYSDMQGGYVSDINYAFPYVDLTIDSDGAPNPNFISALTNDKFYGFKIAVVDEAMNVFYMTSNDQISAECSADTIDAIGDEACPYIAQPAATSTIER
jgi:hypothetical protein